MKNIFLILCLSLIGTVSAAPFSGGEDFSSWSDFEGIYSEMYKDIRVEEGTEICERVLQWPDFLDEEGTLIFSLEDCEEFAQTGGLSSFVNAHAGSINDISRWIEVFQVKYAFERDIWHYEYNLQRKSALAAIWNDGDGGVDTPKEDERLTPKQRTSPVDLVLQWNDIDRVLFGVLAEYPEFESFIENTDDITSPWAETPAQDEWLDQRAEKIRPYTISDRYYSTDKKSISGGYEEQSRMFEEELNPNSLILGKATTGTFDSAFTGSPLPTSTGMNFYMAKSIPASPDIPEHESVLKQTPMGELDGVFADFFQQQSSSELRDTQSNGSRTEWLQQIFVLAPQKTDQELTENIEKLLRLRSETRAHDAGVLEILPLQQFNTVLDVWISVLETWEKVNKEFLTHDKK